MGWCGDVGFREGERRLWSGRGLGRYSLARHIKRRHYEQRQAQNMIPKPPNQNPHHPTARHTLFAYTLTSNSAHTTRSHPLPANAAPGSPPSPQARHNGIPVLLPHISHVHRLIARDGVSARGVDLGLDIAAGQAVEGVADEDEGAGAGDACCFACQ